MRGLEWGRLYEKYYKQPYDSDTITLEVKKLYGDSYVKNKKGIFEYLLGGSQDSKLLEIRAFEESIKQKFVKNKQLQKEYQIVNYVLLETIQIKLKYGKLEKWMQIMLQHGVREGLRMFLIVKCFVNPIIEQKKGINKLNIFIRLFSEIVLIIL